MAALKALEQTNVIRILHVDDDASMLEISKLILQDMDSSFEIDQASCVEEAFQKLSNQVYEVVVSDYEMPQKDGLQFLKELRERKNKIPFILFTGKGREDVAIRALNLGARGYFHKQGSPETVYGELSHGIQLVAEASKVKSALQESEKRYRSILEQAAEAIFIHDRNGQVLDVNIQACKNLGYTREELLKMKITDFSTKATEQGDLFWTKVLAGQSLTLESSQKRKDGSFFNVEVCLNPMTIGKDALIIAFVRDIDTRKKAEKEMQDLKEFNESVIDSISEVLLVIDPKNYKILAVNIEAEKELKLRREELLGKTCYEATHHCNSPCEKPHFCPLQEALKTGKVAKTNHIHLDKDQNKIDVEISVYPYKNLKGEITRIVHLSRNITAQKKAEEELRIAADIFDLATDAIMILDMSGKIIKFNEATCNLYGYSKDEMAKMNIRDIDTPETAAQIEPRMESLFEKGSVVFESEQIRKDNSIVSTEIHARIVDSQGKKLILSMVRDISQRKKTEEALKESEQKHRKLFEGSLDAIFLADAQTGILVDCNPAALALMEREKSEIIGQHQRILHPPHEIDGGVSKVFKQHQKQESVLECQIVTGSGALRNVSIKANLIEMGKQKVLQGVFRDVTEQKMAEEKLQVSEKRVRRAQCVAHIGDWDWNVKTGALVWGEETYRIFGFPLDMIPSVEKFLTTVHPDDLAFVKKSIEDALKGKPYNIDMRIIRTDGILRVANATGEVEFDTLGNPVRMFGMFQDITERKKAEEKLNQTLNQLALVNEKLAVVGSLTRHDVRNKLAAVSGYAYLLKKKHANQLDVVEGLLKIEQAVKDSEDIFEFAKMYEALGVEELKYVDVEKTINEALTLIPERSFNVFNQCHGLQVFADSFLQQMFYNLVDNTKKYGKKTTTVNIHFQLNDSGKLELIYQDDGVGITVDNKSKLFLEGFSTGGSSGFGLFLISKMMDVYGWKIQEIGEAEKGAKFLITIPQENQNGKANFRISKESAEITINSYLRVLQN